MGCVEDYGDDITQYCYHPRDSRMDLFQNLQVLDLFFHLEKHPNVLQELENSISCLGLHQQNV